MKSVKQHVFVDLDPRAGFYWVELGQPRRRRSQDVTPGTRDGPLCDRGRTVIRLHEATTKRPWGDRGRTVEGP
jgi:hypothetical protein